MEIINEVINSPDLRRNTTLSNIIHYIRQKEVCTRNDIAEYLKVNVSTIKRNVDELINADIVRYIGEEESTGGRKAKQIIFNNDFQYNIIIKIEVDKLIFSITNFKPEIITQITREYKKGSKFPIVYDMICDGIDELLEVAKKLKITLIGIGIAISGVVSNDQDRLVYSQLLDWSDSKFRELLCKKYNLYVMVENDVNCATVAEKWLAHENLYRNFVLLSIGEGTGLGIIVEDKLFKGGYGGAGEIGHSIFEKNGYECYCKQKGCFEMYTNFDFILRKYNEKSNTPMNHYDLDTIKHLVLNNDSNMINTLKELGENIGIGISNVIMIFEPEAIVIGGEGSELFYFIYDEIDKIVKNNWLKRNAIDQINIKKSSLGKDSFIYGSSLLIIHKHFALPI